MYNLASVHTFVRVGHAEHGVAVHGKFTKFGRLVCVEFVPPPAVVHVPHRHLRALQDVWYRLIVTCP